LRNSQSHEYHCSLLLGTFAEYDSITYGVNHDSVLNEIPEFNVANGNATGCNAHFIGRGYSIRVEINVESFCFG